jgi:hypothetical protein
VNRLNQKKVELNRYQNHMEESEKEKLVIQIKRLQIRSSLLEQLMNEKLV